MNDNTVAVGYRLAGQWVRAKIIHTVHFHCESKGEKMTGQRTMLTRTEKDSARQVSSESAHYALNVIRFPVACHCYVRADSVYRN